LRRSRRTGIKVNLTYVEDNLVKRVTAEGDPILTEIGSFPTDALPIDQIAAPQQAAIALIRKVGFDE